MDLLYISGVLFPAIPLAMVAIGARYTAVAGLIRLLHMQITGTTPASGPFEVLAAELKSLRLRIELVKYSQSRLYHLCLILSLYCYLPMVPKLKGFSAILDQLQP